MIQENEDKKQYPHTPKNMTIKTTKNRSFADRIK